MAKEVCTGCGSTETIEEIRARNPLADSCCPERTMVPKKERFVRDDFGAGPSPEIYAIILYAYGRRVRSMTGWIDSEEYGLLRPRLSALQLGPWL